MSVVSSVLDGEDHNSCAGHDATFRITMKVLPAEKTNHLGSIRLVGFVLGSIMAVTSLIFVGWVFYYRKQRIVRALQPIFLGTICVGVLHFSRMNFSTSLSKR